METIRSRSNQYLKHARKVRDGKLDGAFFVEGRRLSEELLKSEIKIESVFVTPAFSEDQPGLTESLGALSAGVFVLSESLFSYLSETRSPQGISAICRKPSEGQSLIESNISKAENGLVILLHRVNNPGNLGAIIRSAEAFGAAGLIVTKGSADPFSSTAVRGSMGSVFRLPIWNGIEFEKSIEWAMNHQIRTLCGDKSALALLSETDWSGRSMLIFGSEAHGLTPEERDLVEKEFRVPIADEVESLNLAVAAGIAMYSATNRGTGS